MGLSLSGDPQATAMDSHPSPCLRRRDSTAANTYSARKPSTSSATSTATPIPACAAVAGNWIQAPAEVPLHQNMAPIGGTTYDVGAPRSRWCSAPPLSRPTSTRGLADRVVSPGIGQRLQIHVPHPAALRGQLTRHAQPAGGRAARRGDEQARSGRQPYNGVIQTPLRPPGVRRGSRPSRRRPTARLAANRGGRRADCRHPRRRPSPLSCPARRPARRSLTGAAATQVVGAMLVTASPAASRPC